MDNVACYGSEDKLIDCSYHTDTTEDDHSNDIWINCDTTELSAAEQSTDQSQLIAIAGLGLSLILLVIIIIIIVVIVFLVIITLQTQEKDIYH